ncbi:hypothetical protein P170DRAFT_54613 [Aspergillus steynii IBT 23096]|uniref:Uncharacterized protein n=1 Tax=Aspergillus steynii IBT 23096 TaxID=1392250 RepID=A0A2I2FSC1_9EURO|nr:uncharacterized protein P170DRAFT_54613 [Aspergillus steynii IBT 23096]PLB43519.1 hypothetical protein P170DRAFT_54613 [Aspergillus steynii IBT 23096]
MMARMSLNELIIFGWRKISHRCGLMFFFFFLSPHPSRGCMRRKQGTKWRDMKIAFTYLQLVKRASGVNVSIGAAEASRPRSSLDWVALYDPK